MKILAVADFHGSQYRLNLVLHHIQVEKPDLVVVCGDLTQFGPGATAMTLLNQLPVETFAVHGNIDSSDVPEAIDASKATNIHLKRVVNHDVPFIGIGGTLPESLADLRISDGSIKRPIKETLTETTILVTHVPPYRLQDRVFIGTHGGSKALRTLIDATSPRLVLCGHIHEDPGVTVSGKTTVVNCSMGKRTEGALIDVTDSINVRILE